MATKYCDHGLYGTPVAGGTVPTVAEDGNGGAKTAATMAAMVVTFTGIPAADGAITIAGVTFTAKASGATGNQFNAVTDSGTCATNLKNAINASTTNALKPVGVIAATAPLRNVVNATSSGSVVTIYTRASGSDWNSVTETSTLTNASISTQWSGGANGAFGYFVNTSTLAFPTALAQCTYGLWGTNKPYLGTVAAGDTFVIRSGKTITIGLNDNWICSAYGSVGTFAAPLRFVFDDSTEWADGTDPVFTINFPLSAARGVYLPSNSSVHAKKYSSTYGLNILVSGTQTCAIGITFVWRVVGLNFDSPSGGTIGISETYSEHNAIDVAQCRFRLGANSRFIAPPSSVGHVTTARFTECYFSNSGNAIANSGFFQSSTAAPRQTYYFDSCVFGDFVAPSRMFETAAESRLLLVYFKSCDFGGVGIIGPNTNHIVSTLRIVAASSQNASRDFCIDTMFGFVEWNSARSFPSANAVLLDGTTGWSIHMIPTTTSGRVSTTRPLEAPRISKINSLPNGTRTFTVNLAIHDALTWNKSNVSAKIDYVNTSGVRKTVNTFDYAGGAFDASSATWNQESGGKVVFVDGVNQYHNKVSIVVTTPDSVATDTDIGIVICCHSYVPDTTKGVFVDPEILVV